MSDNPFATPASDPVYADQVAPKVVPKQVPGGIQVIAILCLILGILGLFGSCANGVGFAFQGFFTSLFDNLPVNAQNEFQKLNMQAAMAPASMVPLLIISLSNLIIAPMLIIGSIGILRKKESGRTMLRLGLLLAIFYNAIKAIVSVVGQLIVASRLGAAVEGYEGPASKDEVQSLYEMTKVFGIGGAVVAAIFALALLGFYLWARGYLNREDVIGYFAAFAK